MGSWVAQSVKCLTPDFGSGHDFRVAGLSTGWGPCLRSSLSPSAPLPHFHALSLSLKKKNERAFILIVTHWETVAVTRGDLEKLKAEQISQDFKKGYRKLYGTVRMIKLIEKKTTLWVFLNAPNWYYIYTKLYYTFILYKVHRSSLLCVN